MNDDTLLAAVLRRLLTDWGTCVIHDPADRHPRFLLVDGTTDISRDEDAAIQRALENRQ